jgi:hypothetical protein
VRPQTLAAVNALFRAIPKDLDPQVPDLLAEKIAYLAEMVSIGRTHVARDAAKEIIGGGAEYAESANRLAQQFYQLARGLALLAGRERVTEDDFVVVKRIAYDTLPSRRATILRIITSGERVGRGSSTRTYDIQDLEHLGLVTSRGGKPSLSPHGKTIFTQAGLL